MAMHPEIRREWEEEGYGWLADLLDRAWSTRARRDVWLSLPRYERWLPFRPANPAGREN